MNITAEIERIRDIVLLLVNWDEQIADKKSIAAFGFGSYTEGIKVQTNMKIDRQESAILQYVDFEEKRKELLEIYFRDSKPLKKLIENHIDDAEQMSAVYLYMIGVNIEDIEVSGKKKTITVIKAGLRKLQEYVDLQEEIKKQSKKVQKLLNGEKIKCKCNQGYISFHEETQERFIFICNGCGKKFKADKKINVSKS